MQGKFGVKKIPPSFSHKAVEAKFSEKRSQTNIGTTRPQKMPKTRFQQSNGAPSPRLKKFPAERVRKWDTSPLYVPTSMIDCNDGGCKLTEGPTKDTEPITIAPMQPNNGHGDAMRFPQLELTGYQQNGPSQPNGTSQQHMAMEQSTGRLNQSEIGLATTMQSTGRQLHRPFVPNVSHGMAVRVISPRKSTVPEMLSGRSAAVVTPQSSLPINQQVQISEKTAPREEYPVKQPSISFQKCQGQPTNDQTFVHPARKDDPMEPPNYENKPIEGLGHRNMTKNRQVPLQDEKLNREWKLTHHGYPGQSTGGLDYIPTSQPGTQQQRYLNSHLQNYMQMPPSAQQTHQQMRENNLHQREMQQNGCFQRYGIVPSQRGAQQSLPQQPLDTDVRNLRTHRYPDVTLPQHLHATCTGMTSPQDVRANPMRLPHHQMLMQQQTASQIGQQNGWVQNNRVVGEHPSVKTQLKQFAVDSVSPTGVKDVTPQYPQVKENEMQMMTNHGNAQPPVITTQWQQKTPYQSYNGSNTRYAYQQMQPQLRNMSYVGNAGAQAQNSTSLQLYPSERNVVPQFQQNSRGTPMGSERMSESARRKNPEFTADMLRDQEMLLSSMRQQKIPEDIMKRHFDSLLNEQRRFLSFLAHHEVTEKKPDARMIRKISRIPDEDQRPEWMERITPARTTIQQMKNANEARHQGQRYEEQLRQYDDQRQIHESWPTTTMHRELHDQNHRNSRELWQQNVSNQQQQLKTEQPLQNHTYQQQYPQMQTTNWHSNCRNRTDQHNHQIRYHQPSSMEECKQPQQQQYQHYQNLGNQHNHRLGYPMPQSVCQKSTPASQMTPQQYQQWQQVVQEKQRMYQQQMMQKEIEQRQNCSWSMRHRQAPHVPPERPSSLVKLREYKKYIRPQHRNNGLQDAETIQRALESLRTPEVQKNFEYVPNLEKKPDTLRLNGTQDSGEHQKIPGPPVEYLQRLQEQQRRRVSANGLCNSRNADNPIPATTSLPTSLEQRLITEYPPQYSGGEKQRTSLERRGRNVSAEKENGSIAEIISQHPSHSLRRLDQTQQGYSINCPIPPQAAKHSSYIPTPVHFHEPSQQMSYNQKNSASQQSAPVLQYKFDGGHPQYYQQMQQFQRNQRILNESGEGDKVSSQGVVPNFRTEHNRKLQAGGDAVQSEDSMRWKTMQGQQNYSHVQPTYNEMGAAQVAHNKQAIARYLDTQQATNGNNCGSPEIRQAKTIGGITYLARNADYIPNPASFAPPNFIGSKFLQPPVSFN